MAPGTLHQRLIEKAKEQGWQVGGWRDGLFKKCRENPHWKSEMFFSFPNEDQESELHEEVMALWTRPDAWRIVVEGKAEGWSYDVLVLEFLEVEVTGRVDADKQDAYRSFWWALDATSAYFFRVWHMDRFGTTRPYITEKTIYEMMAGMDHQAA